MTSRTARELKLPGPMSEPGPRGWLAVVAVGAVFGAFACVIPALLSDRAAFGLLAILLGMIASVYLGFALRDGRGRILGIEYVGMVAFAAVATVALSEDSGGLLAAGYLGHGAWDAIHHRKGVDTAMPWWYVPLCLSFDAVVAVYILARFG